MIKELCLCILVLLLIVHTGMGEESSLNNPTNGFDEIYLKKVFGKCIDPVGRGHVVENEAAKFISEGGYTSILQVCDIYKNLIKNWKYKNGPDTGNYEYLNNASTIIDLSYKGDCNEFAIMMASMVKSISGATRIQFGMGPEKSHAWAEVYIGNMNKDKNCITYIINYLKNRYNIKEINQDTNISTGDVWLNLDWGEDINKYAPCPGGSPKFNASSFKHPYSDTPVRGLQTYPLSKFTTIPCKNVNTSTNITFDAQNISDVASIVEYLWDFGDGTKIKSKDPKVSHTYSKSCKYSTLLIVTDMDNLSVISENAIILVEGNQSGPTIESFSANPDNITLGASSSLRWTTLGASNITLSPGFGSVSSNGTQQVSPEGTTTYTLKASNSKDSKESSITILVKQKPRQLIQPMSVFSYSPVQPKVGDMITFDSSKSTGGGGNINYVEWGFGDGSYNSSSVCLHTYDEPGDYAVVLAVTDDNGQKNFSLKRISVLPRELAVESFKFTPNPVCSGLTTMMSWETTGATNVIVTPYIGNLPPSGSVTIYPEDSMGYTICAYNDTAHTKPKTVFLGVKQCMLQVPSGAGTSNIGVTPETRVIKGTVKYIGGNIVRIGVTVKLQEIFNGMIYDIGTDVSSRADGTFEIVYRPESLYNSYNPILVLQAFIGGEPFTDQVKIGNNRRVDLICSHN
jgi:hypothetical protein